MGNQRPEDLNIVLLTAMIDDSGKAIEKLNKQIAKISRSKDLAKLKVKIELDEKVIKGLQVLGQNAKNASKYLQNGADNAQLLAKKLELLEAQKKKVETSMEKTSAERQRKEAEAERKKIDEMDKIHGQAYSEYQKHLKQQVEAKKSADEAEIASEKRKAEQIKATQKAIQEGKRIRLNGDLMRKTEIQDGSAKTQGYVYKYKMDDYRTTTLTTDAKNVPQKIVKDYDRKSEIQDMEKLTKLKREYAKNINQNSVMQSLVPKDVIQGLKDRIINSQNLTDMEKLAEEYASLARNARVARDSINDMRKAQEQSIIRQNKLGRTKIGDVDKGFDYSNTESVKKLIAEKYNEANKNNKDWKKVSHENVELTSKIDPKTNQSLHEFVLKAQTGKDTFNKFKGTVDQASSSINQIGNGIQSTHNRNLTFLKGLETAMQKIPIWIAGMTLIYQPLHFLRDGIGYVMEFNKALTEISIVTGQSQSQVNGLVEEYHNLANAMSITSQEIAKGAVEFYRQGLSEAEVKKRMEETIKYAKISNISFAESAKIVTATVNSMNIDVTRAIDTFAYLGDATATDASEIGEAMQKVGGSAGALGLEFEKVSSWIATISGRTRESASTIGNSIRSILARIQNMKENGFDEEDGTKINEVAKALNSAGIALTDQTGNFRDFGKVMDDLGAKWGSLDSRQKAYISTTVAGSYQQARFLNLMEGYGDSMKLYEGALNSAGSATAKFNLWQQGTEAHLNRLKEAWANVWATSFNSQGIKAGIDALASLANGVGYLVKHIGLIPIAIGMVTTSFMLFSSSLRTTTIASGERLITALQMTRVNMQTLGNEAIATGTKIGFFSKLSQASTITATTLGTSVRGLALSITGLGGAMRFMAGAFLPMLGMFAISAIVEKWTASYFEAKNAQEELTNQMKSTTDAYKNNGEQIDSLIKKHKKFAEKNDNGTLQTEEYKDWLQVQNQLNQLMPQFTSGIDENGNAILKRNKALQEEIDLLKESVTTQYEKQQLENFKDRDSSIKDIEKQRKEVKKKMSQGYEEAKGGIPYVGYAEIKPIDKNRKKELEIELKTLDLKMQQLNSNASKQISETLNQFNRLNNIKLDKSISKGYQDVIQSIVKDGKTEEELTGVINRFGDFSKFLSTLPVQNTSLNPFDSILNSTEQLDVIKRKFNELKGDIKDPEKAFQDFITTLRKANQEAKRTSFSNIDADLKRLDKSFDDTSKNISSLMDAYKNLSDGKTISADKMMDLISANDELATYIAKTNDLTLKQGEILKTVAELRKQDFINKLEEEKKLIELKKLSIQAQINEEKKKYNIFYSLGEIKAGRQTVSEAVANIKSGQTFDKTQQAIDALQKALADTDIEGKKVQARLDALGKISVTDWNGDSDKTKKSVEILKQLGIELEKIDSLMKRSQMANQKNLKGTQEYNDELERQIDLLDQKEKKIKAELDNFTQDENGNITGYVGKDYTVKQGDKWITGGGGDSTTASSNKNVTGVLRGNLLGYESTYMNMANKYGIDPSLLMAISMHETGNGSNTNYNNVGGMMNPGGIGKMQFGSIEEGVEAMASMLKRLYIDQGLTTIEDIQKKYAPIGANNDPNNLNSHWVNGVHKFYNVASNQIENAPISETTQTPTASLNGTVKVGGVNMELTDVQKKFEDEQQSLSQVSEEKSSRLWDLAMSKIAPYEQKMKELGNTLKIVKVRTDQYAEGTSGSTKGLEEQVKIMQTEQDQLHQKAEVLRAMAQDPRLTATQLQEINNMIAELGSEWWDLQDQINNTNFKKFESKLQSSLNMIEYIDNELAMSKSRMSALDKVDFSNGLQDFAKASGDYRNELSYQIKLYQQKQDVLMQEKQQIEEQLKQTDLSSAKMQQLKKKLLEVGLAYSNLSENIKESKDELKKMYLDAVDKAIEKYKNGIDKLKDAEVNRIEKLEKAEEKRHDKRMQQIEDEADAYEAQIQKAIKDLDRLNDKDDYERNLKKLQKERSDIKTKLDGLALDDSNEGKMKRFDLTKELSEKESEIEKLTTDRSRELKKQQYEDDLELNKKNVEQTKRTEDDKYDAEKERFDKLKKDTEDHYDAMKENETMFNKWREDALKGSTTNMSNQMQWLRDQITKFSSDMNSDIQKNLIDSLNEAGRIISSVTGKPYNDISTSTNQTHSKYWNYKETIQKILDNKLEWTNATDPDRKAELEQQNIELYKKVPTEVESALNGKPYAQAMEWYRNNASFHVGGVIGNDAPDGILKATNDFFNLKPNERSIKALVDELYIPKDNVIGNFIPNMRNLMSSISSPIVASVGGTEYNIDVRIDKVEGGEKGAETIVSSVINKFKKIGGKL